MVAPNTSPPGPHGRPPQPRCSIRLTRADLLAVFALKYQHHSSLGPAPRIRLAFNYFTPDDYYEALLNKLVTPGCDWADVGCGRDLFPSNPRLGEVLARRCRFLFGIDPDPAILSNPRLTAFFQGSLEACPTHIQFDLVTLRMVAEHVVHPPAFVEKLHRITKPGGLVVIYTPNRYALASLVAAVLPFALHHPIKSLLWATPPDQTFPTLFLLNSRRCLLRHFSPAGFEEIFFKKLDDCRIFARYLPLNVLELLVRASFQRLHLPYFESCLLAVYRKTCPPTQKEPSA